MGEVPRAGAEEVDAAVERARAAFPAWRDVAPADRSKLIHRLADALEERNEDLAVLEARNAGKPIGDARGEMAMVVDTYRYYAAAPERLTGQTIPVAGGVDMTFREPLGVVGLIVPWNFPLVIASWKCAPALAAGNTIVLKPAELTPAHGPRARADRARGRHPRGRPQRGRRAGLGLRAAPRRAPGRRQDRLHGLDRGRPRHRRRRRRDDQAGDPRARRQVGERRLRRRRPGGRRRRGAGRGLRQRRAGLLRPLADPGRAIRDGRLPRRDEAGGRGDARRRSARRGDRDGPADLGRPARDRRLVRRRRLARGDPRLGARRPRLLVPAHRAGADVQRRPGLAGGDLRPGRVGDPLRRGGGGDPPRQRHDLRPLRLDLDRRRRPRPARRPGDRDAACSRSTPTPRSASRPRSAASSSPVYGRELGPDATDAYTEIKNVYYATGGG